MSRTRLVQCRSSWCPNRWNLWEFQIPEILPGLEDTPHIRCAGCQCAGCQCEPYICDPVVTE